MRIPPILLVLLTTSLTWADDEVAKKPITTRKDKVGQLLEQWWKEGTAAGNVGDVYDNRDGAHSDLNTAPFPQLTRFQYSEDDIKQRRHWAAARVLRPQVTFGNSSTSAPPTQGGSNIRMYYTRTNGLAFLYEQYTKNNIYMYPEHRDHDAGHNGAGDGFGDLYPTNTPYLIASQGSSGSDQPFMRAVPTTLAAFRPEVKKKLTETGLLMPTIQYLLRVTSKQLKSPDEYLSAKAHPTVFEGSGVDELKMVQMAHDLTLESIPPMVQLEALEEDQPTLGRDYFEPSDSKVTEKLADTPCVIARIWRGAGYQRRMVVSAEKSYDVNKQPLKYHWVVLRGDEKRIQIKKLDDAGSKVELTVAYHERCPIAPGSAMESNRIDIGAFIHNGKHFSAPAFVTWYSLDSEARVYDKGRLVEIGYGMGENRLSVANWVGLLEKLQSDPAISKVVSLAEPFRKSLPETLAELKKRETALMAVKDMQKSAQDEKKNAKSDDEKKNVEQKLTQIQKDLQAATKAVQDVPLQKIGDKTWKLAVEDALQRHLETITKGETPYARANAGKEAAAVLVKMTLAGLVQHTFTANFVDQRLSVPKNWRDVYRYDPAGKLLGWNRIHATNHDAFTADGLLITKKDDTDRPLQVRAVRYEAEPIAANGVWKPLKQVSTDETWRVEYAGPDDRVGKRVAEATK